MSLEQKVMADLKTAMLSKDEKSLRGLRAIKAAILLAKTSEGASGELKDDDEIKLLHKLVKQRKILWKYINNKIVPILHRKSRKKLR